MSTLIAAVILTVCLPSSDHCEVSLPHVWRQPEAQDLHICATKAEALVLRGHDARCEVAYSHPLPSAVGDTPIHDLADRQAIEDFLAPLKE